MAASWTSQRIHVIDFEGGLASGVVEYGVVTLQDGNIIETRTRLCRPQRAIPPSDTAIHGITNAAAGSQDAFAAEWEYFANLRDSGELAAHFAGAENALLQATWPLARGRAWSPWLDTAQLVRHFFPELRSSALEAVVQSLGLGEALAAAAAAGCPPGRQRFHAALHDALASALILRAIATLPAAASLTVRQLLTLSTQDPRKREDLVQENLF